MILTISTIICIVIIILAIYYNKSEILILIIFPIFLGYGILGSVVSVDSKVENKVITSVCSEDLGKCRIVVGYDVYDTDDYITVNWFIKNPHPSVYEFIISLNSYGYPLEVTVQLPNSSNFKLNK